MPPISSPDARGSDRSAGAGLRRAALLVVGVLIALAVTSAARPLAANGASVYWGAYINGSTYGFGDAPFDARSIDAFESNAGKGESIIHWGQPWFWGSRGGYQRFQGAEAERVRLRGSIPMITWTSTDQDRGGSVVQPAFRLDAITNGLHDAYIHAWARDAKAWGHPLLVRFDPEMNGDWSNWSEVVNGNHRRRFVPMWRHVVGIFRAEGASNVTWVWAPNRTWIDAPISLRALYPGKRYVDWAGLSAYNWGTNPAKPRNSWQTTDEVYRETYNALLRIAPGKPIMIAETAASEHGGSKASWIRRTLRTALPARYPKVRAFVWFNWNVRATTGNMDWVIESSGAAMAAFRSAISGRYYAGSAFRNLPRLTKVRPVSAVRRKVRRKAAASAARRLEGGATVGIRRR